MGKKFKVGDSFIAGDGSHWVVIQATHWSETDATCASCFKGDHAGKVRHISKVLNLNGNNELE